MSTRTLRTLLVAVPLLAACRTGLPSTQAEHWSLDSVPDRMVKHFTGYRADLDGSFIAYQYQKKKSISRTLRRHFANNSADSPFDSDDASQTKRRPPHSIWPDPLYYMGAESLFAGVISLGVSGGFIPIPIDSLSATIVSDDGWSEFWRGFTEGGDAKAQTPPPVSEFKVKNR